MDERDIKLIRSVNDSIAAYIRGDIELDTAATLVRQKVEAEAAQDKGSTATAHNNGSTPYKTPNVTPCPTCGRTGVCFCS
jgi:hypothetical protein